MSALPTATAVLTDPHARTNVMLPVAAASIPAADRRRAAHTVDRFWAESFGPLATQGGCKYGCKIYARRQGAVVRFAVHHSTAYGHSAVTA